MKFCIAYGEYFAQSLVKKRQGQVRSRSYYAIRGTDSDRLFRETVFSATELAVIGWNGYIMYDLGPKMTEDDRRCPDL